jgi:hypothetical protein
VFGDQTNIIIWDEESHMEHFIRNANFRSTADNFGFIAPTPGRPDLSEASNQAFYTLANLQPGLGFGGGGMGGGMGGAGGAGEAPVYVIQQADVAGYHATTLWSKDAHAINDWMNSHGYVSTPEVEKWAERYTGRGWYLTAFRVTDKARAAASTGTVRMSFKTEKPFNPFYVPSNNIPVDNPGTLRIYFVSDGDYEAKIGGTDTWETPQWTAIIPDPAAARLAKEVELPLDAIPDNVKVETFVDPNFPRPAPDDIYFSEKKPVPPPEPAKPAPKPPIQPVAMIPLFAGLGLVAVVRRRRDSA